MDVNQAQGGWRPPPRVVPDDALGGTGTNRSGGLFGFSQNGVHVRGVQQGAAARLMTETSKRP